MNIRCTHWQAAYEENRTQRIELEKRSLYKDVYKGMDPKAIPLVWASGAPERSTAGFLSPYPDDPSDCRDENKGVPLVINSKGRQVSDSLSVEYYRRCLEELPTVDNPSQHHMGCATRYATRMETLLAQRLGSAHAQETGRPADSHIGAATVMGDRSSGAHQCNSTSGEIDTFEFKGRLGAGLARLRAAREGWRA